MINFKFKKIVTFDWKGDILFVYCENNEAYKFVGVKQHQYNTLMSSKDWCKELNRLGKYHPCIPFNPPPQNNLEE